MDMVLLYPAHTLPIAILSAKPIGCTGTSRTTWEHVATKMFDANIMKNIENFTALKIWRFKEN
jgi:hypothetical protein